MHNLPWQIVFLAIANRMRDGWITELFTSGPIFDFFTKNSQMGRLILWAVPFALVLIFKCHFIEPWYLNSLYFIFLIATGFIGSCCAAWGTTDHPDFTLKSLLQLGYNGFLFTGFSGLLVMAGNYPENILFGVIIALSGILIIPAYVIGWNLPGKWKGTPWGSLIFGFLIGLVVYLGG